MRNVKTIGLCIAAVACSVMISMAGPSAKSYQVTGKITELTDTKIVVEKADGDKWELDRSADTKSEGELKVGEKATITYTMTAKTITSKSNTSADKKADKNAKK